MTQEGQPKDDPQMTSRWWVLLSLVFSWFQGHYEELATPFQRRFRCADLMAFLARLGEQQLALPLAA